MAGTTDRTQFANLEEIDFPIGTTGTGLDFLTDGILSDAGILHRVPLSDVYTAAAAADAMGGLIVQAIRDTGVAVDGTIDAADIRDISAAIIAADELLDAGDPLRWAALHGDDAEDGTETGFHLVQNDGGSRTLYGAAFINTVADGIFHLGFPINGSRLTNEDGNNNASVEQAAHWLGLLLADDLADIRAQLAAGEAPASALVDPDGPDPYIHASTGTGLDEVVEIITTDYGLMENNPTTQINGGAASADALNELIIRAIGETGVAWNGTINAADVRLLNEWFRDPDNTVVYDFGDGAGPQTVSVYDAFVDLHGDDEADGTETGFHRVQNNGAWTQIFGGNNAVNTVADGIYHIGFEISGNNLTNEDGNNNASVGTAAHWLSQLLAEDLAAGTLIDTAVADPRAIDDTGTDLDLLVEMMLKDDGLNERISLSDLSTAAWSAHGMNQLLVQTIWDLGAANDGDISVIDLYDVNAALRDPGNTAMLPDGSEVTVLELWTELHGDDADDGTETGFHLAQNDGDTGYLFDKPVVDTVADGIYHTAFAIENGRFLNEDGNANASVKTVSHWLNALLAEDLANPDGLLINPDVGLPPAGTPDAMELLALHEDLEFDGELQFHNIPHDPAWQLPDATIAFSFVADDIDAGRQGLVSKDARDYGDGGHTTIWIDPYIGVFARFQSTEETIYLYSQGEDFENGVEYHVAFSFDGDRASLYIDGHLVDYVEGFAADWTAHTESLVIGASSAYRSPGWVSDLNEYFDGTVSDLVITDRALYAAEVYELAAAPEPPAITAGDFDGLITWLDSSAGSQAWLDLSGHGNHATNVAGGAMKTIADSPLINSGGPYAERTTVVAFATGDDVTSRQVLFEEGAGVRGIAVLIEDGMVFAGAWNRAEDVWGPVFLTGAVEANSSNVVSFVLDSSTHNISGMLNGESLGTASYVTELHAHVGDIGIGGARGGVRTPDNTAFSGDGLVFDGVIQEIALYDRVLTPEEYAALDTALAAKWEDGGPAPQDPPSLPPVDMNSVIAWFDAAQDDDISDGWADASGNGHAAAAAAGATPLTIANSTAINTGEVVAGRTFSLAFGTGGDVENCQVLYEEGGNVRGLAIYVEDGQVYVNAWNLAESAWPVTFVSGAVDADSTHTLTVVFDGSGGTLSATLDGAALDAADGVGLLYKHSNGIGLGGTNGNTRLHDDTVLHDDAPFLGDIKELLIIEDVEDAAGTAALDDYLADKWLDAGTADHLLA